uniref:Ig-like domain-containing protein n=1 Tax=Neolamprologus brichardi TaxID=32507 RepID=A0A3Q4GZL8_NEOBR
FSVHFFILLTVHFNDVKKIIQTQSNVGVTYTSAQICAVKGSTGEMSCTYTYPPRINNQSTEVQKRLWFTAFSNNTPVDLKSDSHYAGRLQCTCSENSCSLMITDLRESDSAEYKFRFRTNQPNVKFTGLPGVNLSVTDLQVQVNKVEFYSDYTWVQLTCQSSCRPDVYVWIKNGRDIFSETTSSSLSFSFFPEDRISCAVKGHEKFPSPSVYAPKLPSVSASPSAEIVEGSSVTLTCSSDANPAANYVWYKNVQRSLKAVSEDAELAFSAVQSSDSGKYFCTAKNKLGVKSAYNFIDVKYAPKLPSVSVSPSAEIVEGSSVTLTCSSDANPAANYTWYKVNHSNPLSEDSHFVFNSIQPFDSGEYYCKALNTLGMNKSGYNTINVTFLCWNIGKPGHFYQSRKSTRTKREKWTCPGKRELIGL